MNENDKPQTIDPMATVKVEVLRSYHGEKITVKTKYNTHFKRDVEHIEISAVTVTLPIIQPKRNDPFDFAGVLKS